jgi:hypothetical protein
LRHRHVPRAVAPATATTVALWVATAVMLSVAGYYGWITVVAPLIGRAA